MSNFTSQELYSQFDAGKFHSEFHGVANFAAVKLYTVDFVG